MVGDDGGCNFKKPGRHLTGKYVLVAANLFRTGHQGSAWELFFPGIHAKYSTEANQFTFQYLAFLICQSGDIITCLPISKSMSFYLSLFVKCIQLLR